MGFGSRFAFQPSLVYSQKGFKTSESGTKTSNGTTVTYSGTSTLHVNYLERPLNFVFTIGGTQGFQVFAGPYLAMGVGGKAPYGYSLKDNSGMFSTQASGSYQVNLPIRKMPAPTATAVRMSMCGAKMPALTWA